MLAVLPYVPATRTFAQTAVGATLTVLRGTAAVLKADGTKLSPGSSGLATSVGDQIATVGRSSALVTFFDGSELELGADTTIVVREMASQGGRTTIDVESVVGATVHCVVTLTDPGSSYRVEAGGTVALVRGTVFAHYRDPSGDITVAVADGDVEFPGPNQHLRKGERRTATERGDIQSDKFDPATSLFAAVTSPVVSANPSGTDNPGQGTGSRTAPEQRDPQQQNDQQEKPPRVGVFIIAGARAGSTRLEVSSTAGFNIGDSIIIDPGQPNAEAAIIVGFGSILIDRPLKYDHGDGEEIAHTNPIPPYVPPGTGGSSSSSPSVGNSTGPSSSSPASNNTPPSNPPGNPPSPPPPPPVGATIRVSSDQETEARDNQLTLPEAIKLATGALPYSTLDAGEQTLVTFGTANAVGSTTPDTIVVQPTVTSIPLTADLPPLSAGTDTIDGAGKVAVIGPGLGGSPVSNCLTIQANGNTIRGMTVTGCLMGIHIVSGTGNTIGGSTVVDRNTISLNQTGILVASNNNQILGNYIGTDPGGASSAPNTLGIQVTGASNTIGGAATGSGGSGPCTNGGCNLISGNDTDGIAVQGAGATGNIIRYNQIGGDASLSSSVPNGRHGILIDGAPNTTVGGVGQGNTIIHNANQRHHADDERYHRHDR
jgi:FecR protein